MGNRKAHQISNQVFAGFLFYATAVPFTACQAEFSTSIVADGTLGTAVTQNGAVFDIDGGTIHGTNQFHSFDTFSIGTGDIASFNGPAGTENIISRVTGGSGSEIDGTLASTIPGANLFLLNPAGILFGPNAQLAVDGAFHATTADYARLGDNGIIFVEPGSGSVLTAAAPSAFGFINPEPAAVQAYTSSVLAVPEGQTLSLVGGPVEIGTPDGSAPGFLLASQGRVNLVSVAGPGEVAFDGTGFNVNSVSALGDVSITGGSIVDGREVFIQGGQLVIEDSLVSPGVLVFAGLGTAPDGGEVNVQASNDINISGTGKLFGLFTPGVETRSGSSDELAPAADAPDITLVAGGTVSVSGVAAVQSNRLGPGNAADVTITADTLVVNQGGSISVNNQYAGSGGTLTVNARNVELSDSVPTTAFTGLAAQSALHPGYANADYLGDPFNPDLTFADSGTITVNATDSLSVSGGAEISTDSFGFGNSGNINLNVGNLTLSKDGAITGKIAAQSGLAGNAGKVTINATGTIEISDGFQISTTTLGSGSGGIVDLTAGESLVINGTTSGIFTETAPPTTAILDQFAGRIGFASFDELRTALGIPDGGWLDVLEQLNGYGVTAVTDLTAGNGGTISVVTPQLIMNDEARISSSTLWDGNGGEVFISTNNLSLDGGAAIRSQSGGIRGNEVLSGTGDGGIVNINVEGVAYITGQSALGPSGISTNTIGDGNGGNILLAADNIYLSEGGSISATTSGAGQGGNIELTSNEVTVSGSGSVTAETSGTGSGGTVEIAATNLLSVTGADSTVSTTTRGAGAGGSIALSGNQVGVTSGGSVTAEASSTGNAGTILIAASGPLTVSGANSTVSTTTSGSGTGGNITLSGENVDIQNGGSVTSESLDTGEDAGDAGSITISAGNKINLDGGTISTRTLSSEGGNIVLTAPKWVYLLDSEITTSVGTGESGGGDITIDPEFVILNNSNILANAFGGPGGNIDIVADYVIISNNSRVDASSELGIDGTVNISNPDQDIAKELAVLPENYLDVTGLISDRCGTSAGSSSLVSAGPGGLAVDPDGYLPSFGAAGNVGYNGKGESSGVNSGSSWWALATDPSALQLARVNCTY